MPQIAFYLNNAYDASMPFSAEQALEHWQKEGLIDASKAAELRKNLGGAEQHVPHRALSIFSAVGAVLIGLGVILFVASNWSDMTPLFKIIILLSGILLSAWGGYDLAFQKKTYPKTGDALLFVNALLFGASIFLVAQIFHLPLHFWWGGLLWFLGTAAFAYILQSRMHLWLAVPLLILFLGWLRTYSVTGFWSEFDFLFRDRQSIITLFPLLGAGILSTGLLHHGRKNITFGAQTLFHWGLFLTIFTIVISTADEFMLFKMLQFPRDNISIVIAVFALVVTVAAVLKSSFLTKEGRAGLIALACYVLFLYVLAEVPSLLHFPESALRNDDVFMLKALFVVHILLAFVFLLIAVWYGTKLRQPAVINMGMLGIAIMIIIQYFSWAFSLMNRSLFFIVGGLIILGLSTVLERKRRELLSTL